MEPEQSDHVEPSEQDDTPKRNENPRFRAVEELLKTRTDSEITIEATVDTGLEFMAIEECREKFGRDFNALKERGSILFNIDKTKYAQVKELRSVDNLHLILSYDPCIGLKGTNNAEDVSLVKKQAHTPDWDFWLNVWKELSGFEGVTKPTKEQYSVANERATKDKEEEKVRQAERQKKYKERQEKNAEKRAKRKAKADQLRAERDAAHQVHAEKKTEQTNGEGENIAPSVEPVVSSEETLSVEPVKASEEAASVEPVTPSEEAASVEPVRPSEEAASVEPVKPSEEAASVEPVKPSEEAASVEPVKPSEEAASVEPVKPSEEAASVEPVKPSEEAASVEPVKPSEEAASVEPVKPSEEAVSVEPVKPSEEAASVEPVKPSEEAASVEPVKPSEEAASVEPVKPSEEASSVETVKKSPLAEAGEISKPTDVKAELDSSEIGDGLKDPSASSVENAVEAAIDSDDEIKSLPDYEREIEREIDSDVPPAERVLRFRATCFRVGKHSFGSMEVAREFGGELQEKFNWVVDLVNFNAEIVLFLLKDTAQVSIALTKRSLHRRNISFFGPTTLRSTVCHNLLRLADVKPGDLVLDPLAGGGSIPIEGAMSFPGTFHIGGDNHPKAVSRFYSNVRVLQEEIGKKLPIDAIRWDARRLPLNEASVDVIVTDMPFGVRLGSKTSNRDLYRKALLEMARVARPGTGRAILLTQDRKSFSLALTGTMGLWWQTKVMSVNIGGLDAAVFTLRRTAKVRPDEEDLARAVEQAKKNAAWRDGLQGGYRGGYNRGGNNRGGYGGHGHGRGGQGGRGRGRGGGRGRPYPRGNRPSSNSGGNWRDVQGGQKSNGKTEGN